MKSIFFSRNHCWVVLAVWAGAPSCWKVQLVFPKFLQPKPFTTVSKNEFTVGLWIDFYPSRDKNKICPGVCWDSAPYHDWSWFLPFGMNRRCSGMSWTLLEMIRSFWGWETSWIVNSFSSENNILSTTSGPARDNRPRLLCSRSSLIALVSMWTFLRLRDFNPRSSCTTRPMDLELIPKSRGIFRMEPRRFRTIRFLIFAFSSRILTLRGRPLWVLSFKLPVSLYLWIVRYILCPE